MEAHGGLLVSFNGAHVVDAGTDEVLYDQPIESGRPVQGLRAIASELGLEAHGGLLVSFNGAHVVDAGTDEVLYDQPIEVDVMRSLVELASELGLEAHGGLLVSFNGAHVVDAGTDEVLYDQPIEVDVMRSLVEHIRSFDVIPWITQGARLYVERGSRHVITYRGDPFDIVEYERRMCDLELHEVDDLLEVCGTPQDKLLCASEPEYLQQHWRRSPSICSNIGAPCTDRSRMSCLACSPLISISSSWRPVSTRGGRLPALHR